jgi:4-hydroxybenzoate polyprenyltransferase
LKTGVFYSTGNRKMLILIGIFYSLRPKQWTKNLLIFAGILFSQNIFDLFALLNVLAGFFVFCLISGCVYLINDLNDIEEDKIHPVKHQRPIASGMVTVRQAVIAAIILFLFSISVSFMLNLYFGLITLVYFLVINLYTFLLKDIVIIDVLTIALGFVLRAIAGVVIINVYISPWLIICTVLLALFLALGKRRHEISLLQGKADHHRKVLQEYSIPLLDQMITTVTTGTVIAYSLYTFNSNKGVYLMFTIPFVIYGIFRYLYLIHQHDRGGSPEAVLLEDKALLLDVVLWVVVSILILYFI